jgi:molecular chaperone DnaK (HSP70)
LPYLLGVDVGSGAAWTAICRRAPEPAGWGPAEPVATDAPPAVPGLFRRCGDDVPVFYEDLFITPQALVVEQARKAADTVWQQRGEGPERISVACPTSWGPGRVGVLRAAFDDAGMGNVVLITRAHAVIERHQVTGRPVPAGRPVVVCRIGRVSTEVTFAVPYEPGRIEVLGVAATDELGGDDLVASPRSATAALLDLVHRTARAAGADLDDLAAVLPAGGGAAHPVVPEALAGAFTAPVVRDADPWLTVARGAALALRPPGRSPRRPEPVAEVLVMPTELLPVTDTRLRIAEPGPGIAEPAVRVIDPGEIPARPPLQLAAPSVGKP